MATVTVSPKYQVVIPKEVREKMDLKPGQKLQILQFSDRIEFVPIRSIKEMRGFLKGIETDVPREKDRI
jgi:AbrB family looped-hinge helix DNA binding protein